MITVSIATKNSGKTIRKCILSVLKAFPKSELDSIVIIDNGSTDNTLKIVQSLRKKYRLIKIFSYKGLLGGVRVQQAINSKTDWVVFVDSDVFIYPNWWKVVKEYITKKNVFWIQTLAETDYSEPYKSFFEWSIKNISAIAFYATAVRRNAILNFKDKLEKIHGCEDLALYEEIKRRGGNTISIKEPLAFHYGDRDDLIKNRFIRSGQSYRLWKGYSAAIFRLFRTFFTNIGKVFLYYMNKKISFNDFIQLLIIQTNNWILFSKGVFSSTLIRELHNEGGLNEEK